MHLARYHQERPSAVPEAEPGEIAFAPIPAADLRGKDFVDFDEDLQVKDIVNSVADGYRELELVKRYSTVGMGPSQGRHSALATAQIVPSVTGRKIGDIGITTVRPPLYPEKLGVIAGDHKPQFRHTPIDAAGTVVGKAGDAPRACS